LTPSQYLCQYRLVSRRNKLLDRMTGGLIACVVVALAAIVSGGRYSNKLSLTSLRSGETEGQSVHWVFVTDCSAYMFNEGNMLLASAHHVRQPGAFTWIVYGCEREEQKEALKMLAHPRARVWHSPKVQLKDTDGKKVAMFQASNRPVSVLKWFRETQPQEEAISIIDPDMFFMRPVVLVADPQNGPHNLHSGQWQTEMATPGHGVGAMYGQGCVPRHWGNQTLLKVCDNEHRCLDAVHDDIACMKNYSSGPPWIFHRDDAEKLLETFAEKTIKVHQAWPDLLSEQVAYGVAQMQLGMEAHLDTFWFISGPDSMQPWDSLVEVGWDACQSHEPPPPEAGLPIFFHAASTYDIPHLTKGFRLHKDHVHKDLLDCDAPLIHHPPTDALERYKSEPKSKSFRDTWSVCAYTNMINFHVSTWKKQFCQTPNLETTAVYPPYGQQFLNKSSWVNHVFRSGGWTDVDYKPRFF